jgi:hypothetical protein
MKKLKQCTLAKKRAFSATESKIMLNNNNIQKNNSIVEIGHV